MWAFVKVVSRVVPRVLLVTMRVASMAESMEVVWVAWRVAHLDWLELMRVVSKAVHLVAPKASKKVEW